MRRETGNRTMQQERLNSPLSPILYVPQTRVLVLVSQPLLAAVGCSRASRDPENRAHGSSSPGSCEQAPGTESSESDCFQPGKNHQTDILSVMKLLRAPGNEGWQQQVSGSSLIYFGERAWVQTSGVSPEAFFHLFFCSCNEAMLSLRSCCPK